MIQRIQKLPKWLRVIIFSAIVTAIIVIVFLVTLAVAYAGVNAGPRTTSIAMQDTVTVREWATLPGDDAYPAAMTIDPDGNVYTGSYLSGAIWRITPEGEVSEIPGTRDIIDAVSGLEWAQDGLYVLTLSNPLAGTGMSLWRIRDKAAPEKLFEADEANRIAYDIARDGDGNLYVSYIGVRQPSIIMIYPAAGEPGVWWTAPDNDRFTGITYDAANDRLIAVDTDKSILYAIPRSDPASASVLYEHKVDPVPNFDDVVVAPDGMLYLAALGINRVAQLTPQGDLTYLAGAFRGSSRVAYDPARKRLYVNNWDQRSLLSDQVLFVKVDVTPKLPFALDVIEWK